MALFGDLGTLALPDLLYIFKLRRMTGRLTVRGASEEAHLQFQHGNLISATSSLPSQQLGQVLLRHGRLTAEQLGTALALQATTHGGQALGELLVGQGWLSPDEVTQALSLQVEEVLYRVLTWKTGEFNFTPMATMALHLAVPAVNVEYIILEATRRADEAAALLGHIPSLDCGVSLVRDPSTIKISTATRLKTRIVTAAIIEGASTLRQISHTTGLSADEVTTIVYDMLKAEIVIISDEALPPPTPPKVTATPAAGKGAVAPPTVMLGSKPLSQPTQAGDGASTPPRLPGRRPRLAKAATP